MYSKNSPHQLILSQLPKLIKIVISALDHKDLAIKE